MMSSCQETLGSGAVVVAKPKSGKHDGLTKLDSFVQIFCLFQGTCFFLFPGYMKDVGMIPGIVLGYSITLTYLYLTHLYFWSERQLKKHDPSIETITLYTLVEQVFTRIGKLPRVGLYLKLYLKYEIILSWFLGLSFSLKFICKNFQLVLHNFGYEKDERMILLYLAIPLALACVTPNLVTLNKAFYLSSIVIILISAETFFYILTDQSPLPKVKLFGSFEAIPTYLNNIIFTISMTPLIFPYRNEMKREKDFTSLFGSLNMAISSTILLCMTYSISCNIRYGNLIHENIIQNLPNNLLINVSNTAMTITVILSAVVIFYGIFLCLWEGILEEIFEDAKNINIYRFASKATVLSCIILVTAITPSLSAFLNLLCSFSLPYDTIIQPVALESVIIWRQSGSALKKFVFILKNIILTIVAILFAIWSFTNAMRNIFFGS